MLSDDGKLADWAASDILIGEISDPSKFGVSERWAEQREGGDRMTKLGVVGFAFSYYEKMVQRLKTIKGRAIEPE